MVHGTHNAVEDPRNEDVLVYVNGELLPRNDAKISVFDSGYLVGDGVWEGLRLHGGVLVFWDEHLDRLFQGAKAIGMDLKMSRHQIREVVWKTLDANDMKDGVHVRVMFTRGIKKTPSQDPRLTVSGPNLVIIAEYKQADPESRNRGVKLHTSSVRRGSPDYLDPRLNCHSKIHEVQALIQALEAGADEALMLDVNGFVSTCNATNFFMVKNGEVWTSTGQYCMNGITRAKVIDLCLQEKIPCFEKNFSLYDVYSADEAFVTGSFGGITPVTEIDGRVISTSVPGNMAQRLQELYTQAVENAVARSKI
ncbi:aminotransferase class IV [Gracilimonas mengyeensis]|uniref:branched-chain-amino-acid transaminase n=1 Tax=Gracilimonas mengyeensis TaxID=1302730 RepID=A0A521BJW1_9BACT|nr:aminotransferase class IV [Gracilimonas mengyeensis]SMO47141.1 branched-chain amino acid aminotransferase [Gracilimonas mengyeensis]